RSGCLQENRHSQQSTKLSTRNGRPKGIRRPQNSRQGSNSKAACAGLAAAARIDPSEKHRSATRNTPQTARISRHGREGISYPFFLTRGGKYLPAPERAKNPLQSPFRVGFPARTRPFPSVSLRVPPCSVPPRSRSSLFYRHAQI